MTLPNDTRARRVRPWIAGAAIVVLLVAAGVTWWLWPSDSDEAADRCHDAVLAKLKAPSTAEFTGVRVVREDGRRLTFYTVTGQVDSENGFGAKVRSGFTCKVQVEGGAWLVTSATVG